MAKIGRPSGPRKLSTARDVISSGVSRQVALNNRRVSQIQPPTQEVVSAISGRPSESKSPKTRCEAPYAFSSGSHLRK